MLKKIIGLGLLIDAWTRAGLNVPEGKLPVRKIGEGITGAYLLLFE